MIASFWNHLRLWLAVALIAALVLDGFALAALADDDDDRISVERYGDDGDDDDDDEDEDDFDDDDDDDDFEDDVVFFPESNPPAEPILVVPAQAAPVPVAPVVECEIEDDDGNQGTDGFCADQAIVRLAPGTTIDAVNAVFGTLTIAEIEGQRFFLLQLPQGSDEAALANQLAADFRVAWAELNVIGQAPEGRPRRFFPSGDDIPQPGSLDQAYAPQRIGVPAALACASGVGVTVAVIDTGLDADHPAFVNTALRDGWNAFSGQDDPLGIDDFGNGEDDDNDGQFDEMTGHGTHVAGIVTQIAPGATIMPIKALDSDGLGQAFYLARAIYRAAGQNADVINLSLGSTADARIVREATEDALAASIFIAAAAGNSGGAEPREFPATQDGVFGVAATDEMDRGTDFTSTHPSLSLSAPGAGIVSAFALDQPPSAPLGSPYALWSGTSMATPWVSGAAALLLERNPGWTASDVAVRLENTAAPISGQAVGMGSGRLDIGAAVDCGSSAASDGNGG